MSDGPARITYYRLGNVDVFYNLASGLKLVSGQTKFLLLLRLKTWKAWSSVRYLIWLSTVGIFLNKITTNRW